MKILQLKPTVSRLYYKFDAVSSENMTTYDSVGLCYYETEKHFDWKINARKCYFIGRNCGIYVTRVDVRHFAFAGFQFEKKGSGIIVRVGQWVDTVSGLNEIVERYGAKEVNYADFCLRWAMFIKKMNAIDFAQMTFGF